MHWKPLRKVAFSVLTALLVFGQLQLVSSQAAPRAASVTTYSGRATVVKARILGINTTIVDAGPLPGSGGADDATLLTASVAGLLNAELLDASTAAAGNDSRSHASVLNLGLTVAGVRIAADVLSSEANASCREGGASTSGSSLVTGLRINGKSIIVTGQPNQTISLGLLGKIVINEQIKTTGPHSASITVNALHVSVLGTVDVVVASSHADITCAVNPPCNADFIAGNGAIDGTPNGARGVFGVAGGIQGGVLTGHLSYVDKNPNSLTVEGTSVTSYAVTGSNSRRIQGTAKINGVAGFTYSVDLSDNGVGASDTFQIMLSNGYSASGNVDDGNIQLTKCQ